MFSIGDVNNEHNAPTILLKWNTYFILRLINYMLLVNKTAQIHVSILKIPLFHLTVTSDVKLQMG